MSHFVNFLSRFQFSACIQGTDITTPKFAMPVWWYFLLVFEMWTFYTWNNDWVLQPFSWLTIKMHIQSLDGKKPLHNSILYHHRCYNWAIDAMPMPSWWICRHYLWMNFYFHAISSNFHALGWWKSHCLRRKGLNNLSKMTKLIQSNLQVIK